MSNNGGTYKMCRFGAQCTSATCTFAHPPGRVLGVCKHGSKCHRYDCSYYHPGDRFLCNSSCSDFSCQGVHPDGRTRPCISGKSCTNPNCTFLHPKERCTPCPDGKDCCEFSCEKSHPPGRRGKCNFGPQCFNNKCTHLHPSNRVPPCELGVNCNDYYCSRAHSSNRPGLCPAGRDCAYPDCKLLHPSDWIAPCHFGAKCNDYYCQKPHPSERQCPCPRGASCPDFNCSLLHPKDRVKCSEKCSVVGCKKVHPYGWQPKKQEEKKQYIPSSPNKSGPSLVKKKKYAGKEAKQRKKPTVPLRTLEERIAVRNEAKLPILASYQEFISRLRSEKILVVTAETGSGKTTQLPQYAAEAFGGLVVCTQPRALAAVTIASRIALEFDNAKAGSNVGYRVGGGNKKEGDMIMLMTDAALVAKAQHDPLLKKVSVLIIDEAHERSLNTDIVIGIAKLVMKKRPEDFYVVIASATIDPKPFLDFFLDSSPQSVDQALPQHQALSVPGRTFPVQLEYDDDIDESNVMDLIVPRVVQAMKKHSEGHCLVFLPGSNEVDKAVKLFNSKGIDDMIALPLYGSLPPEEQQRVMTFSEPNQRMVVFCTNVAETSLTVPNVRLVVDSGLAKEARYDPKRRITVLELVYVSQSSADQRKGRAGRTAPGHCIRLYSKDKITRYSIEPEILRSSLDLVILQLRRLGYDPMEFPLMSRPNEAFIRASVAMLTEFGCLDPQNSAVTDRGILFSELPFDPRMSYFVSKAHESHNALNLAVEIASILTAPGSIFFMGGSDKAAKETAKYLIAEGASNHDSDLLYLHSIYRNWLLAGTAKKHDRCVKHVVSADGCKHCRSKYAGDNSLNNKVLDIVRYTSIKVLRTMELRAGSANIDTTISLSMSKEETIGKCLISAFKEYICEILLPDRPDAGVLLLDSGSKGTLSGVSALSQPRLSDPARHIVSMSITYIPSGRLIVDYAHPLQLQWLPVELYRKVTQSSLNIIECFSRPNIGSRFEKKILKYLQEYKEVDSTFVLPVYESERNTLRVFGPARDKAQIRYLCTSLVDQFIRNELEYEMTTASLNGDVMVTIVAGMQVDKLEYAGLAHRVRFDGELMSNVHNDSELMEWLIYKTKVTKADVKWLRFFDNGTAPTAESGEQSSSYGVVVFCSEQAAEKAKDAVSKLSASYNSASSQITYEEEWGRCVFWTGNGYVEKKELMASLSTLPSKPKKVNQKSSSKATYKINMSDLSNNCVSDQDLRYTVASCGKADFWIRRDPKFPTFLCNITFASSDDRDNALVLLKEKFQLMQSMITTKFGKSKVVYPKFDPYDAPAKSEYLLIFSSSEEANAFIYAYGKTFIPEGFQGAVTGHASLVVKFPKQFPSLEQYIAIISTKYNVTAKYDQLGKKDDALRVSFQGGCAARCGQAAQALQQVTTPLRMRLSQRQYQVMITELVDNSMLKDWSDYLTLRLETRRDKKYALCGEISVHGEQQNQGSFMAKVREYTNSFIKRYTVLPIDSRTASHFRFGRLGAKFVKDACAKYYGRAKVSFLHHQDAVEFYVFESLTTYDVNKLVSEFKYDLNEFLKKLGGQYLSDLSQACVYCGTSSPTTFTICGHHYCTECLKNEATHLAKSDYLPVLCAHCQYRVSVTDLRTVLYNKSLSDTITHAALAYLKQHHDHPLGACAFPGCCAILTKYKGYYYCPDCSHVSCLKCGTCDDPVHLNRSCEEFAAEKRRIAFEEELRRIEEELRRIEEEKRRLAEEVELAYRRRYEAEHFNELKFFAAARQFVDGHWTVNMPYIQSIFDNEGLLRGCHSLYRFYAALKKLNLTPETALQNGFFAWHGTGSEEGVIGICDQGFDPKRRSGQAYGTGEYFGQVAATSHGYARGTNRMLVSFLLRVHETSTHGNYCYVVNNPLDWSYAYCLPVLVITYGSNLPKPAFIYNTPYPTVFSASYAQLDYVVSSLAYYQWKSPFRWFWQQDSGNFEPYSDSNSALFEERFSAFQCGQAASYFETPPIVRYIDDTPQKYLIDFSGNTQKNLKTGYIRRIQRKYVDVQQARSQWQVYIGMQWIPFEFLVQGHIDSLYRSYVDGLGPGIVRGLHFPGRPESYTLNFMSGEYTNEQTNSIRPIRKVPIAQAMDTSKPSYYQGEEEDIIIQLPPGISNDVTQRAWSCLRGLEPFLYNIVRSCSNNKKGSLGFVVYNNGVVLRMRGSARHVCALLVGRVQAALHEVGITTGAGITATGTFGSRMLQNPRLLQLLTPTYPIIRWYTRDDALLLLAHAAIWKAKCTIYGGFVRDWVIRGESANDVDTLLPTASNQAQQDAYSSLVNFAQNNNIRFAGAKQKGMAYTLVFSGSWSGKDIEVDLVYPGNNPSKPGVDCDVGNLCINYQSGLTKKVLGAGEPDIDVAKSISHCQKKKFVFFYNLNEDTEMCKRRLSKYLSRGWTCLSQLTPKMQQELSSHSALIRSKPRYCIFWWN